MIDCWKYDADIHCNDCKAAAYGPDDDTEYFDSGRNPVSPIFVWDWLEVDQSCGTCREYIREQAAMCECGNRCELPFIECNSCMEGD